MTVTLDCIFHYLPIQIQKAESEKDYDILNVADDVQNLLAAAVFANKQIGNSTNTQCFQDILTYEVILKRKMELDKIRRGMDTVGFARFLSRHR